MIRPDIDEILEMRMFVVGNYSEWNIGVATSLLMTKSAVSFYKSKPNNPLTFSYATLLLRPIVRLRVICWGGMRRT